MPCPVDLHLLIVEITRLRIDVATKSILVNEAASRTKTIFKKMDEFDLEAWVEGSSFATKALARYYGESYQLAVKLYGILTLPRPAVLAVYPNAAEADGPRTSLRQRVLKLLKEVYPQVQDTASLQWPFVVTGVAAAIGDGAAEDQDFIAQTLYDVWRRPLADSTPYKCLQKLKAFWLSGQTEWEDCFYEPTPC